MENVLETIATLAKAGFSKYDIVGLLKSGEQKKEEPAKEEPKKEEPKKEEPKTQEKSEVEKLFESLGMKIDTLTGAIQKQNINSMGVGSLPKDETADDVLAKIINPYSGKEVE